MDLGLEFVQVDVDKLAKEEKKKKKKEKKRLKKVGSPHWTTFNRSQRYKLE